MRGRLKALAAAIVVALLCAACSGSSRPGSGEHVARPRAPRQAAAGPIAPAQGEIIGSGPVRVALILPLSGSAAPVGRSMANGARLAMEDALTAGGQTIHLVLKDSGESGEVARAAARQALSEGAELILGPLTADAVAAAGAIARPAGIPLIGFSSTASVATEGIYLLSVLPEAEIMRVLTYVRAQGRHAIAGIIPDTPLGRVQAQALRQAANALDMRVVAIEMFADETRARLAIERVAPAMRSGQIDALYLPDSATAPSFGILLGAARVDPDRVMIIGSADWEESAAIAAQASLAGAVYPAIDPAGRATLAAPYRQRFGSEPHQLATLAYSAVLVANTPSLSRATPSFGNGLVSPTGFLGRDGPLRFYFDGLGEYGLVMRQVTSGGATTIDAARLSGLPLASSGGIGTDAGIPPAAEFR